MSVNVTLTRAENGEYTIDLGSKALPKLVYNPMELSEADRAEEHMGARLLLAASLACYINTMANDLKRGGASAIPLIEAQAEITKERDSQLRTRYTHIELNVEADVADEDRAIFETVRSGLLRGSLVTYSLEEEMDLDYNIEAK
ncbi:organic hydroperoxide reductase OsmC/OhrA [Desulfobaculum xiamenense]|uniref:Organic hydroperoxide reductase OsmC/OhrA n=1 Tax=Desulfobaculum xiamenense TaxID=995050 RepID=A0A846QIJ2_9BACT|nr:osmotically inducible protein OsmC [Desulfobaculum xiamenense]NJB67991.1 organic hydroperoxide reductase OsmC/OhrA [Desulfobaculum xiamenense]